MYVEAEKQIAAEKKCQLVDLHAMFLGGLEAEAGRQEGLVVDRATA